MLPSTQLRPQTLPARPVGRTSVGGARMTFPPLRTSVLWPATQPAGRCSQGRYRRARAPSERPHHRRPSRRAHNPLRQRAAARATGHRVADDHDARPVGVAGRCSRPGRLPVYPYCGQARRARWRAAVAAPARPPRSPPRRPRPPQGGSPFDRRKGVNFRPALTQKWSMPPVRRLVLDEGRSRPGDSESAAGGRSAVIAAGQLHGMS